MIRKFFNLPSKIHLSLLYSLLFAAIIIFTAITIVMYIVSQDTSDKFFKNKLTEATRVFASSYQTAFRNTKNPQMSFDITTNILHKLDGIHLIRVWNAEHEILLSYPVTMNGFAKPNFSDISFKSVFYEEKQYGKIMKSFFLEPGHQYFVEIFTSMDNVRKISLHALMKSLTITFGILLLLIPILYLFLKKMLVPLHRLSVDIQKFKNKSPSSWRQLQQHEDNDFLNEIIVAVNELIFRSQRSLVCQENLGRFLSHEIKTPLTNLMNEIEMLEIDFSKENKTEVIKNFSKQTIQDVLRIRSIINNICDLASVDKQMHLEQEIDIIELLSSQIQEFQRIYKCRVIFEHKIESSQAVINLNADYLWILLSNILRNSLEYGFGREIPPLIRLTQKDQKYIIEFSDDGPGFSFSKKMLLLLHEKDSNAQLLKVRGAGLVLCFKLATMMNAELEFENKDPQGAVVYITLPVAPSFDIS